MTLFTLSLIFLLGACPLGTYYFFSISPVQFFNMNLEIFSETLFSLWMLLLIFTCILFFCMDYMKGYPQILYFFTLKFLFVGSMVLLLVSSSAYLFVLGWDGLGLTSYLLVSYYSSWDSSNSAMVTMMTNRLGDVFLLWGFSLLFFQSFNFMSSFYLKTFSGLFIFTALTKSSQFPFSAWLPQAMAAPTPVSSLVHSSTLVTAGVFLCIKFWYFFFTSTGLSVLFFSGWTTIFVSGLMSIIEKDGKKLIALSTLNQLGFMFIGLSSGNISLVLFHLISHAFFKSCMFIQMGFLISVTSGSQDARVYSFKSEVNLFNVFLFFGSIFSLLGLFFMSGFFSKESVLSSMLYTNIKALQMMLLCFSVFFSFFYSMRLMKMMTSSSVLSKYTEKSNTKHSLFSSPLFILGVVFGSVYSSNFFSFGVVQSFFELKLVFSLFLVLLFSEMLSSCFLSSMLFQDNFYKTFQLFLSSKNNSVETMAISLNNMLQLVFQSIFLKSTFSVQFSLVFVFCMLLFFLWVHSVKKHKDFSCLSLELSTVG